MIRTVPDTGTEEIELYMRTYYSLLRSTDAIKIQALVETHTAIDSSLHIYARDSQIDISTLVYSTLRLPPEITEVELVVLGQLEEDFKRVGYADIEEWPRVHASGRRRRTLFDGQSTLAVMIASRSDIDDIIPILTALQIEWNKLHNLFRVNREARKLLDTSLQSGVVNANILISLAQELELDVADLSRLQSAWKGHFLRYLGAMAERRLDLRLQMLAGSLINYRKAVSRWWGNLSHQSQVSEVVLYERPVYFVSSNTHAIANLVSGYAFVTRNKLMQFMNGLSSTDLLSEWKALQTDQNGGVEVQANFYYYLLKQYQTHYPDTAAAMLEAEKRVGMTRISARHGFDIEAQVLQLSRLDASRLDPRVADGLDLSNLASSDALIINIDYPLGLAAFELLTAVGEGVDQLLGIYVMGKAATLNGRIGDVMLVNVVHDEHSDNTYLFDNCFRASHIAPYLYYGTLLDNQKAITAKGTFLQNRTYMDVFYREGYTVLEMEAGPYLSAVYEMIRPQRHPYNEIVNLYPANIDVGVIHYASDTPYSKGHNLGAGSLGYRGMDSTYASAVAILRRILQMEIDRCRQSQPQLPEAVVT